MATLKNLTVFVEHTGKRIPVNQIDDQVSAQEFLSALADKINLPAGTRGIITRKMTRKQILANQTLREAGVGDDETLIADFDRTAG